MKPCGFLPDKPRDPSPGDRLDLRSLDPSFPSPFPRQPKHVGLPAPFGRHADTQNGRGGYLGIPRCAGSDSHVPPTPPPPPLKSMINRRHSPCTCLPSREADLRRIWNRAHPPHRPPPIHPLQTQTPRGTKAFSPGDAPSPWERQGCRARWGGGAGTRRAPAATGWAFDRTPPLPSSASIRIWQRACKKTTTPILPLLLFAIPPRITDTDSAPPGILRRPLSSPPHNILSFVHPSLPSSLS